MKKYKLDIIILAVIAVVLGLWIWSQRPGLAMDSVLPSHPLFFGRLSNVGNHIDEFIHSDLGKNLAAIDLPDVLARNNFSKRDVRDVQRWQTGLIKLWNNPLIKRFLGKEAAVAVYHSDKGYRVFVVLRLTFSTRVAEWIGQLSHHWGEDITLKQQRYGSRVINHLEFKDHSLGLAYVRIRDLLILAPESRGHLEEIIDVYKRKEPALNQDLSFNFIRQNAYPASEGLLYVNAYAITNVWWRGEVDSKLSSMGYQSDAFPVYGLSYVPGAISKYKMIIGLNQQLMPDNMRKIFTCPAVANDSLKLVPVDAIVYNWGGCYDFQQAWNAAKGKLRPYPEIADGLRNFKERLEAHFDIDIKKDVLPLLGHEIGGYLTDVDMEGNYPYPRLLIFVKIKDRAKIEAVLNKITGNAASGLQSEKYNQVDIHYFTLPIGGNMDPGYGFLGDYLLLSTTRQLIKRSIDAYNNSLRSIVSDDVVEQFKLTGDEKFHSVTLMKTAELSRRAQDFLGWIDKYLSGQVTMAAAYKQDGDNKKDELDRAIADKSAELVLAQKKLLQLKTTPSAAALEDADTLKGAIANLSREQDSIRDDIANYTQQRQDLSRLLDNYALGAQSAKLTMYNMDTVISPVLKGLESINAQAVTMRFGDKIWETEFLVK